MTRILLLMVLAPACSPSPTCGDGAVDPPLEACDDGKENADVADACRTDCTLPVCGDGIVDAGEGCDDATAWGGDGCTPSCRVEAGVLESDGDDTPAGANALGSSPGHGSLPEGDVDCWSFEVEDGAYVSADVSLDEGCPLGEVRLTLHGPGGGVVAVGTPDAERGCSPLDPLEEPGARFLETGTWAICVEGFFGDVVPAYRLDVQTGDSCVLEGLPSRVEDDADGDGLLDVCDDDDDDDGILDEDDNCPRVPNSGAVVPLAPASDGWLRDWLLVGPLTGVASTDRCLPTPDRLGDGDPGDDASAVPALAESVEDQAWTVHRSSTDRIGLGALGGDAPRESYQALWVRVDAERDLTLSLGPDDGARAWVGADQVLEDARCQGTTIDGNEVPVTLQAGWNRLLVKVYDQGGGWGVYARFKDGDTPVTDLEISLQAGGPWRPDQTDSDGDGVGDVCDDTPAG